MTVASALHPFGHLGILRASHTFLKGMDHAVDRGRPACWLVSTQLWWPFVAVSPSWGWLDARQAMPIGHEGVRPRKSRRDTAPLCRFGKAANDRADRATAAPFTRAAQKERP